MKRGRRLRLSHTQDATSSFASISSALVGAPNESFRFLEHTVENAVDAVEQRVENAVDAVLGRAASTTQLLDAVADFEGSLLEKAKTTLGEDEAKIVGHVLHGELNAAVEEVEEIVEKKAAVLLEEERHLQEVVTTTIAHLRDGEAEAAVVEFQHALHQGAVLGKELEVVHHLCHGEFAEAVEEVEELASQQLAANFGNELEALEHLRHGEIREAIEEMGEAVVEKFEHELDLVEHLAQGELQKTVQDCETILVDRATKTAAVVLQAEVVPQLVGGIVVAGGLLLTGGAVRESLSGVLGGGKEVEGAVRGG